MKRILLEQIQRIQQLIKEGDDDRVGTTSDKGSTTTSSSGSYISATAWGEGGILTNSGREDDIGEPPPEVDDTVYRGSYETPETKRGCKCEAWQIAELGLGSGLVYDPRCCTDGGGALPGAIEKPIDSDTCCKKCDNGKFSDRCCDDEFGDERCVYDTITDCQLARKRFEKNKCKPIRS